MILPSGKTTIRLLTPPAPKRSHCPTLLTIDWDGVTAEQMRHWAQAHIIECCRAVWQHSDPPHVPETYLFECVNHPLHNDPVVMATREVREQSQKTKKERWEDLMAAIASLPIEEQEALLGPSK